jgi:hypothetical protein
MNRLMVTGLAGIAFGVCTSVFAQSGTAPATSPCVVLRILPSERTRLEGARPASFLQPAEESDTDIPPAPSREFTPPAEEDAEFPDRQQAGDQVGEEEEEKKEECDREKMAKLEKQVIGSHKALFYNNDFSYLFDSCYHDWHLGDNLKRRCLGDWGVLDIGGQYRLRHHSERNIRGLGLTGRDDDFLLHRWRLYANTEIGSNLRFYAEMIDAQSNYEEFAPRSIEENRFDMLNLFADARLYDGQRGDLWARVGRQELLYGSQRLVSPLDWSNTRRTFEGGKLFWSGEDWDVDAFWVRPMNVRSDQFDSPDQSQEFMGVYATSKIWQDQTLDLYWLRLLESDDSPAPGVAPFEFDTLGARWQHEYDNWLCEAEAGVQWGEFNGQDHNAGFFTIGGGRKIPDAKWKPVVWIYYDWASGDETLGNGFHHLFPLGHRYLGWMDLYGRRNLEDINFLVTLEPTERIKLFLWHHIFFLQDGDDVPYTVAMTPEVPVPGGSQYLGQELDLALDWTITPRTNLLLGYSHFFSGEFYDTNPTAPFSGDADFFYTQYTVNF